MPDSRNTMLKYLQIFSGFKIGILIVQKKLVLVKLIFSISGLASCFHPSGLNINFMFLILILVLTQAFEFCKIELLFNFVKITRDIILNFKNFSNQTICRIKKTQQGV